MPFNAIYLIIIFPVHFYLCIKGVYALSYLATWNVKYVENAFLQFVLYLVIMSKLLLIMLLSCAALVIFHDTFLSGYGGKKVAYYFIWYGMLVFSIAALMAYRKYNFKK